MRKEIIEIEVKGTGKGEQQVKQLDKSIKGVGDSAKSSSKESDALSKSALDGAKSFSIMGVSVNSVSKGLKFLKISLIATGIGAIVVAVGALAAAFLSTQEGVDKLNSVLMPLKEVMQTILGVAQKLGKGLMEMVSGDVQKGWQTMGKAVENVGDQMDKAWQNGTKLYELQKKIREDAINDGLVISRLNRLYADQLQIAEDINNTVDERRAAFKAAIAAQEAITKLQARENDNQIKLAQSKALANDTDDAAKKAINDLIAKGEDIQSAGIKAKILLEKKLNVVKVGGIKDETAAKDEAAEKDKERKSVSGIVTTNPEEELLRQQLIGDQKIVTDRAIESEIARYREQIRQEDLESEKANTEAKIRIAQLEARAKGDALNSYAYALSSIGNLIGKETAAGKAASVASTLISTYLSAQQAYQSQLTIPTPDAPIRAALAAGVAVASGLANVKAILSVKTPKGGGSAGISTPSAPQAQTPQFNVVGSSDTNQLATAIGGQTQKPIKAYVLGNEVTTAQGLFRNIIKSASIG